MAWRLDDADLTAGQRRLLLALVRSPLRDAFYLTGGSNLAGFRFRHRRSDDLDLFTEGEVPLPEILALLRSLPDAVVEGPERRYGRYGFQVRLPDELVRLEFVRYPFPSCGRRDRARSGRWPVRLPVASTSHGIRSVSLRPSRRDARRGCRRWANRAEAPRRSGVGLPVLRLPVDGLRLRLQTESHTTGLIDRVESIRLELDSLTQRTWPARALPRTPRQPPPRPRHISPSN